MYVDVGTLCIKNIEFLSFFILIGTNAYKHLRIICENFKQESKEQFGYFVFLLFAVIVRTNSVTGSLNFN